MNKRFGKMKKNNEHIVWKALGSALGLAVLLFLAHSCELAEDLAGTDAGRLEGDWLCEEESELFKATKGIFHYEVSILQDEDVSNRIIIFNFYQLGPYVAAEATVSGLNITLNPDVEGDFTVNGSGTISSNYKRIDWNYTVDDGSGVLDHVTAVYTRP